ncbi:MAG: Asp-tRNA(Asn)/Glu-tRNA(Gln) amidotransferase subunit GatC [Desulfuromonadaceae bacterium]|nr:Asp-tRNA(Asn)/Glu-tRNA(Gln) amidotransferase subunit GatC [Desulfuromonadaceae bacterium]
MREKVTREEVMQVASLARLEFSPAELDLLTNQLDTILERVEQLNELDTSAVEPTSHAVPLENVFRDDEVRDSIGVEQALRNAPVQAQDCFVVPKVIE